MVPKIDGGAIIDLGFFNGKVCLSQSAPRKISEVVLIKPVSSILADHHLLIAIFTINKGGSIFKQQ